MRIVLLLAIVASIIGMVWYGVKDTGDVKSVVESQKAGKAIEAKKALDDMKKINLSGYVSLDIEPFLNDQRVRDKLQQSNIAISFARLGSRSMATNLKQSVSTKNNNLPDFYISSGVVAGNQISEMAKSLGMNPSSSSPLYTPLVMATWKPIAEILKSNGIASLDQASTDNAAIYNIDNNKLLDAMLKKKRWVELKNSAAFPVTRSVLVSTTDVASSNSAAMYLALMSFSLNNSNVVEKFDQAESSAIALAELFYRQGYQENYVNGNFDDYTAVGMGKSPLAFIYENQMVSYARTQGKIKQNMVLAYPTPTIFNKQVFVALSEPAKKFADILSNDKALQTIALEYGFRSGPNKEFVAEALKNGLRTKEEIIDVIDPPAHTFMTKMIEVVASQAKTK